MLDTSFARRVRIISERDSKRREGDIFLLFRETDYRGKEIEEGERK